MRRQYLCGAVADSKLRGNDGQRAPNPVVGGERVRVEAGAGASNFEADPGRLVIVFKVDENVSVSTQQPKSSVSDSQVSGSSVNDV